jgi:valyl-tRNA synthetase
MNHPRAQASPSLRAPSVADAIPAKKEAKRLEKEAKLAAKQLKQPAATPAGEKKSKAEKEKKADEPAFVNTTPKGDKKGSPLSIVPACF